MNDAPMHAYSFLVILNEKINKLGRNHHMMDIPGLRLDNSGVHL